MNTEPPGANCALGGLRVDTGLDSNNDGTLESGEIQHTAYVCSVGPVDSGAGADASQMDAGMGGLPDASSDVGGAGGSGATCSSGAPSGPWVSDPVATQTATSSGIGLRKELSSYPNYSPTGADILAKGQTGVWAFPVPAVSFTSAMVVISIVADDHSGTVASRYSFTLTSGGVTYAGVPLPHGAPTTSIFTNWVTMTAPATASPGGCFTLTITNTSQTYDSGDWIAIDWVELDLVTSSDAGDAGGGPADAGADGPPATGGVPGTGGIAGGAGGAPGTGGAGGAPATGGAGGGAGTGGTGGSGGDATDCPLTGKPQDLGLLDGNSVAYPTDLNDLGAVVGQLAGPQPEAFIWRPGRTMFALPGLPGATADAVNNAGQVAGLTSGWTPYLWPGSSLPLPFPRPTSVEPVALNELGHVVNSLGYIVGSSVQPHAYLWRAGQQGIDLGTLGGPTSHATALNDADQVVGRSDIDAAGTVDHAFLWEGGVMRDLGTLGGDSSTAVAINAAGQIAGNATDSTGAQHAVRWDGSGIRDLGTLGGATSTAVGMDASGRVIGNSQIATGETHAFFWDGTTMRDLGSLWGAGTSSWAVAISDSAEIVGTANTPNDTYPFLWRAGVMRSLDALGPGTAVAVNRAHQMTGTWSTVQRVKRAFFLDFGVCPASGSSP